MSAPDEQTKFYLDRDDIKAMTPDEIVEAKERGRFNNLLNASQAPHQRGATA